MRTLRCARRTAKLSLTAVQALSQELDTVRNAADPETSARLAGAEDELAAIHDEMHQQQQEMTELLTGVGAGRTGMLRRFLSTLPLATVVTGPTGKIIEANGAAHAALRIPMGGLDGKPLFAFIAQDDRRDVRSALSTACAEVSLLQITASITPRRAASIQCYFALMRESYDQGSVVEAVPDTGTEIDAETESELPLPTVRWVIVPDYEAIDGPPSHEQLEALTRLCRLGASEHDLRTTLGQVVKLCLQAVAEADDIALLVGNPLEPTMALTSSAAAQHLDGLQHVRASGPTFDAYRTRQPVALSGDAVGQHPGITDDAQARQVRSLLAVPLMTEDLPIGVLTLYSFGQRSVSTLAAMRQVMPFVEAAQTLIRDTRAHEEMRRTQEQLEAALTSRAVIDQAKGMIMISLKCNADEAFGHLVRMSSTRHEKVRDVAQSMVDDVLTKRSQPRANP